MPDETTNGSLPQKIVDRFSRIRLGHEAVMLEDAREVLANNRSQVASHSATHGLSGNDPMGNLILGDSVTNVMQPKQGSPWKWIALAAALATGGIGLFQAPAIIDAIKPDAVPEFTDTDTDTQFELNLGKPE